MTGHARWLVDDEVVRTFGDDGIVVGFDAASADARATQASSVRSVRAHRCEFLPCVLQVLQVEEARARLNMAAECPYECCSGTASIYAIKDAQLHLYLQIDPCARRQVTELAVRNTLAIGGTMVYLRLWRRGAPETITEPSCIARDGKNHPSLQARRKTCITLARSGFTGVRLKSTMRRRDPLAACTRRSAFTETGGHAPRGHATTPSCSPGRTSRRQLKASRGSAFPRRRRLREEPPDCRVPETCTTAVPTARATGGSFASAIIAPVRSRPRARRMGYGTVVVVRKRAVGLTVGARSARSASNARPDELHRHLHNLRALSRRTRPLVVRRREPSRDHRARRGDVAPQTKTATTARPPEIRFPRGPWRRGRSSPRRRRAAASTRCDTVRRPESRDAVGGREGAWLCGR